MFSQENLVFRQKLYAKRYSIEKRALERCLHFEKPDLGQNRLNHLTMQRFPISLGPGFTSDIAP